MIPWVLLFVAARTCLSVLVLLDIGWFWLALLIPGPLGDQLAMVDALGFRNPFARHDGLTGDAAIVTRILEATSSQIACEPTEAPAKAVQ